jgi:hypothetical protein
LVQQLLAVECLHHGIRTPMFQQLQPVAKIGPVSCFWHTCILQLHFRQNCAVFRVVAMNKHFGKPYENQAVVHGFQQAIGWPQLGHLLGHRENYSCSNVLSPCRNRILPATVFLCQCSQVQGQQSAMALASFCRQRGPIRTAENNLPDHAYFF